MCLGQDDTSDSFCHIFKTLAVKQDASALIVYYFCICRKEFAAGGFDMLISYLWSDPCSAIIQELGACGVKVLRRVLEEFRLLVNSDWWIQSLPGTMTLCDISGFLGWFPDRQLVNSSGSFDLTNDAA